MKICTEPHNEAGVGKGDNSSCESGQQGAAAGLAVGLAAMTPEDMEVSESDSGISMGQYSAAKQSNRVLECM